VDRGRRNNSKSFMDNRFYPPNMRKPMRDSHFAVTRRPGERRHSDESTRRVHSQKQTIVVGDRRSRTHEWSLAVGNRRLAADVPQRARDLPYRVISEIGCGALR
jgi:hypothetical protein